MRSVSLVTLSFMLLVACGNNEQTAEAEGFIRLPASGANMSAAYLTVSRDEDDQLVGAEVKGIARTELHTVIDNDGVMQMRPVEGYPIEAGKTLVLEPGGNHLMLIGLNEPLEDGDVRQVTLTFASGLTEVVELEVKGARAGHSGH